MSTENPSEMPLEKITGDQLAAPLIDGMPDPTPSAVSDQSLPPHVGSDQTQPAPAANSAPPVNEYPNAVDKKGTKFDPSIHRTNPDGTPRTNSHGTFVTFKQGRPPKDPNAPRKPSFAQTGTVVPGQLPPAGLPDEFELAARAYVKAGTGALCVVISDEWKPENETEEKWLVDAVAEYLRAKGEIDLTPGQLCALAIFAYAGKRVPLPKTQEKIKSWSERLRGWFKGEKK